MAEDNSKSDGRLKFTRRAVLAGFAALAGRLWFLQHHQASQYVEEADAQRFRLISVPADRGVIYDRKKRLLVRNVPRFNAVAIRADLPNDEVEWQRTLERAATLLNMRPFKDSVGGTDKSIEEILEESQKTRALLEPIILKQDIDQQTAFLMQQQQLSLPGITVQVVAQRQYLLGPLVSHVLGYVGPVPESAVEDYQSRGYSASDIVGLAGLEHSYESVLRGKNGEQHMEVDVMGRPVRIVGEPTQPQPGANLVLTLDTDLQEVATKALEAGLARKNSTAGVVIALDPRDGSIRAMVSLPSYDNNIFTRGVTNEELSAITNDPHFPMVNRSIAGAYPPGSTFKIITASGALQEAVIDPSTTRQCNGIMYITSDDGSQKYPFYCFNRAGHGIINVVDALRQSCDIFFYQVAGGFEDFKGLGQKRLASYAMNFGLGGVTGVDLPGELAGLIPDPKWKRLTKQQLWVTGDTYNCAIGQGDILTTPLQMSCATMTVANGGTLYQPRLADSLVDNDGKEIARFKPRIIRRVPVSTDNLGVVRHGMREVVANGTARILGITEIAVAGKTGTAEFYGPRDKDGNLPTHAWFISFAPYENPEIVVVALLENSGEGAYYAVPVVAEVLRAYFGLNSTKKQS